MQNSRTNLLLEGNFNWLTHCHTTKDYNPNTKIVKILNDNASVYKKVLVYTSTKT